LANELENKGTSDEQLPVEETACAKDYENGKLSEPVVYESNVTLRQQAPEKEALNEGQAVLTDTEPGIAEPDWSTSVEGTDALQGNTQVQQPVDSLMNMAGSQPDSEDSKDSSEAGSILQPEAVADEATDEQMVLEEIALDDQQVVLSETEPDMAETDNNAIVVDAADEEEDNNVNQHLMDGQLSVEDDQQEAESISEILEPESDSEAAAVEDDVIKDQLISQEESLEESLNTAQTVSGAGSDIETTDDSVEDSEAMEANSIKQLLVDQESIENEQLNLESNNDEIQEQCDVAEEQLTLEHNDLHDAQIVLADIIDTAETSSTISTTEDKEASVDRVAQQEKDKQEVVGAIQSLAESNESVTEDSVEFDFPKPNQLISFSTANDEMKDNAGSEQMTVELPLQISNEFVAEEATTQAKLPKAQAIVQEADDSIMDSNEHNEDLVQMETDNLDDLIDLAFVSKESQDYNNAFKIFNKALALYPNSEAAPFLVVEIGNILKNKGNYDEAIKVFSDGRNLSQTRQDEMMGQEFISTIAYLRITKNMLLQNHLGSIPFLEIPTQIMDQIDEEFREWRSVGNI
jgi:tetratricopeptide (TPR) repeat protein